MKRTTSILLVGAAGLAAGLAALPVAEPAQSRSTSATPSVASVAVQALGAKVRAGQAVDQGQWLRVRRTRRQPGYPRPGHSVRQGQRMARKARNQARHRNACRARA